MRAKEFMNEDKSNLEPDVARSLPGVYVFPELTNQDPYKQYRFGLELADAATDNDVSDTEGWGEKMIVLTYSQGDKDILDRATKKAGAKSTELASRESQESPTVNSTSPVAARKKNKYGV